MSKIHRIKNYKDLLKVHALAVHRIKKEASAKASKQLHESSQLG